MRTLYKPTDQEFLDRTPVLPQEVNLVELLAAHQERQDQRQIYALETKDFRVEITLHPKA